MRGNNLRKLPSLATNSEINPYAIQDLQKTIDSHSHLSERDICVCNLCANQKFQSGVKKLESKYKFSSTGEITSVWLKQLLDGLTVRGTKSLKLFLPDILFVEGDTLQIYQTTRKEGRICKMAGSSPLKSIYSTFLRLRSEYKQILEQKFNEELLKKLDPQFVHEKYFDKLIPSHFHQGVESATLQKNKHSFMKYVLHQNPHYELQKIEEHKLNEKEPFCIVKYNDGNAQLFNQLELEIYALEGPAKLQHEVCFFQSYIKYKQEADSIHYSEYTPAISEQLYRQAEHQVLVLIGGLNKYDQNFHELEVYEEAQHQLMLSNPKQYIKLMTNKIVLFLAMAARIYVSRLKLKWIANDVGAVYLQQVMQMETTELPRRAAKFKLPPQQECLDFYSSDHNFIQIYKDMNRRKALNTIVIKENISDKTFEQMLQIMEPDSKQDMLKPVKSKRGRLAISQKPKPHLQSLSKTIDDSHYQTNQPSPFQTIDTPLGRYSNFDTYKHRTNNNQHKNIQQKRTNTQSLDRSARGPKPEKHQVVDNQINTHFLCRLSNNATPMAKDSARHQQHPNNLLSEYLVKKDEKAAGSLLGNTIINLNKQRMKRLSERLEQEKQWRKRQQLSSLH